MPELPEVEILARQLHHALQGRSVLSSRVLHPRTCRPLAPDSITRPLAGAKFAGVGRRAKYLLFHFTSTHRDRPPTLIAHLGMSGRIYIRPAGEPSPKHAVFEADLDQGCLTFEDPRRFGRILNDPAALEKLGPEPLEDTFTTHALRAALGGTTLPIKPALLEQTRIAGIGNIYASESLFLAGVDPRLPARRLSDDQVRKLHASIRQVLRSAIELGAKAVLDWSGSNSGDRLFYFGSATAGVDQPEERFSVYDRERKPCFQCGRRIQRIEQAGRGTFFCPKCQASSIRTPRAKSGG